MPGLNDVSLEVPCQQCLGRDGAPLSPRSSRETPFNSPDGLPTTTAVHHFPFAARVTTQWLPARPVAKASLSCPSRPCRTTEGPTARPGDGKKPVSTRDATAPFSAYCPAPRSPGLLQFPPAQQKGSFCPPLICRVVFLSPLCRVDFGIRDSSLFWRTKI